MLSLLTAVLLSTDAGVSLSDYQAGRAALEAQRAGLAKAFAVPKTRAAARGQARAALLRHLDTVAFPAWTGTPWEFYGKSETPRQGAIACGYFVTTVLQQSGLRIEKDWLAQQVSATLVATLAQGTKVLWLRHQDNAAVVQQVREAFGDGLYAVGLDLHTGLLRLDGARADFCHSSFLEPAHVVCEPAATAGGFASNLHVVGDALPDAVVDAWLAGRDVESVRPRKGRRQEGR